MKRLGWWSIIIVLSAVAAVLAAFGLIGAPLRPIIAFWFLLVCPGMAFVRLLHIREPFVELTLAVALSITLGIIVAEGMALNHLWSPNWGLFVLICVSLLGVALQVMGELNWLSNSPPR